MTVSGQLTLSVPPEPFDAVAVPDPVPPAPFVAATVVLGPVAVASEPVPPSVAAAVLLETLVPALVLLEALLPVVVFPEPLAPVVVLPEALLPLAVLPEPFVAAAVTLDDAPSVEPVVPAPGPSLAVAASPDELQPPIANVVKAARKLLRSGRCGVFMGKICDWVMCWDFPEQRGALAWRKEFARELGARSRQTWSSSSR